MRNLAIRIHMIGLGAMVTITMAAAAHAGTLFVANNGIDSASCGTNATPCRSITQGIANAEPRDHIIVGPGRYSGETGAPGCGCFLAINKSVVLTSSAGAASTVIDARAISVNTNVLLIADDAEFGRPGLGFTVTNSHVGDSGIAIDGRRVKVRGNQVIADLLTGGAGVGIRAIESNPGPILIEANQVMLWTTGIQAFGAGKTISKNQVSLNHFVGIDVAGTSAAGGNVAAANANGLQVSGEASVLGNALVGSEGAGVQITTAFLGTIARNDIVGNSQSNFLNCGLANIGVPGVVASHNYWGARTGPGPDPADDVCDEKGGTTTATPFAATPFTVRAPIRP